MLIECALNLVGSHAMLLGDAAHAAPDDLVLRVVGHDVNLSRLSSELKTGAVARAGVQDCRQSTSPRRAAGAACRDRTRAVW